jgi:hypothetical protein
MAKRYGFTIVFILALIAAPVVGMAGARLISVVPVGTGCVSGPTGPAVQAWDIEPGETYTVTIDTVVECANGGTDATLNVRVNSSSSGNVDLVATKVADGVYEFDVTLPTDAICTFPIFYCTTPGSNNTGIKVMRNDGGSFQAHLRAASFGPGCTNPTELGGELCDDGSVSVDAKTWSQVKILY